ncbi:DUF11 domain-containing protein [Longispora fulva]|uniref:Putative repeat protein (TIGR01451 family) n=1 Tax=Longispora fulva TaxID=619741 RepID=A0A8J7GVC8_9ACTN|nr:DUF11 domain-containing protein [Longispora fulva]MBG6139244.1 putative repeat protein (TIGR01451 family) [Longispora fulva]
MGAVALRYSTTVEGGLATASATQPLALSSGATVRYARLYWWSPRDDALVDVGAPGRPDTSVAGELADYPGGFQGTADVTALVRQAGPGAYRVAAARWTLLVVHASPGEPLRAVTVADGLSPTAELPLRAGRAQIGWIGYDQAAGPGALVGTVNGRSVTPGDPLEVTGGDRLTVSGNGTGWVGAVFAAVAVALPQVSVGVSAEAERLPLAGDPVVPGARIVYTYTVSASPVTNATNVWLIASIPDHTTVLDNSGERIYGQIWVPIGTLAAGATTTATLSVRAEVAAGGDNLRSTATVLYAPDYLPSLTRTATGRSPALRITPAANLKITNELDVTDAWRYTLTVSNQGPSTAAAVVLRDTVPTALGAPEAMPGCTFAGQLLTCELGDVPPGTSVQRVVTLRPEAGGTSGDRVPSAASVASPTLDPDLGDNVRVTAITH